MRRSLATLTAAVLPAAFLTVSQAVPAHAAIVDQMIVTQPGDNQIEQKAAELIASTDKGTVKVAAYDFYGNDLVSKALADAVKKPEVKVQLVVDDHAFNSAGVQEIKNAISSVSPSDGSEVKTCDDGKSGCNGSDDLHAKFIVIDNKTGDDFYLVTTANWGKWGGGWGSANSAVVWRTASMTPMNSALRTMFNDLWAKGSLANAPAYTDSPADADLYTFPQASGDPIAEAINNLDCLENGVHGNVRIAAPKWSNENPPARSGLYAAIKSAVHRQCVVDVITEVTSGPSIDALKNAGANIWNDTDADATLVHTKLVLLKKSSGYKQVFMGSHNMSNGSLRTADEVLLRLNHVGDQGAGELYNTYSDYFDRLTGNARMKATDGWDIGEPVR